LIITDDLLLKKKVITLALSDKMVRVDRLW